MELRTGPGFVLQHPGVSSFLGISRSVGVRICSRTRVISQNLDWSRGLGPHQTGRGAKHRCRRGNFSPRQVADRNSRGISRGSSAALLTWLSWSPTIALSCHSLPKPFLHFRGRPTSFAGSYLVGWWKTVASDHLAQCRPGTNTNRLQYIAHGQHALWKVIHEPFSLLFRQVQISSFVDMCASSAPVQLRVKIQSNDCYSLSKIFFAAR